MERKRIIKNGGHIVVKNPLAYELPKREVVIKSGRTLYRFTDSYNGERACLIRFYGLWNRKKQRKMLIKNAGTDTIDISNLVLADCPPIKEEHSMLR